jgi:hypothetical protein
MGALGRWGADDDWSHVTDQLPVGPGGVGTGVEVVMF